MSRKKVAMTNEYNKAMAEKYASSNAKLKPCPICGSDAILKDKENASGTICVVYACCDNCGRQSDLHGTDADAIIEWNGD